MFVLIIIVSNYNIQMLVPIMIVSNWTIQMFVPIIIVSETLPPHSEKISSRS